MKWSDDNHLHLTSEGEEVAKLLSKAEPAVCKTGALWWSRTSFGWRGDKAEEGG